MDMKEEKKQKGKRSVFGRGLLIYIAVLVAIFGIVLAVFWNFLASYDASLEETALKGYLSAMTEAEWKALISSHGVYDTNAFEDADALYEKSAKAISDAEITYVKNYQAYSEESPVYYLARDGKRFAQISLKMGGDVGFGFTSFDVAECHMIEEAIAADPFSVMVLAPKDAEVMLNGMALDEAYITEADLESRRISKYSIGHDSRPKCVLYTVEGFYDIPTAEASLSGASLTAEEDGALFIFDYPDETFSTLTVKAPSNAVVRVNGIKLSDEPVSTEVLGDNPYEAKLFERITMNTYVLSGLFEQTDVTCFIDGKAVSDTAGEGMLMFAYPDALMYHTRIMAPAGAELTVNGIPITAETQKTTGVYDGFDERTIARWLGGTYPMCDVYDIGALYFAPEVKATLDGVALNVTSDAERTEYTVLVGYPTVTEVSEEIAAAAEDFVRTFMYYMTRGYYEFDRNIVLAQSKALRDSDAFRNVRESGYGVYFNSCYDIISNEAEAVSVTYFTEQCVKVAVEYEIDKTRHSLLYHDEGRYEVTLVCVDGQWSTAEFESIVTP